MLWGGYILLNDLDIEFYESLYDAHLCMNCIDLPIAAGTGFYDFNYYFYYSFFFSLLSNWVYSDEETEKNREKVFDIIGLEQKIIQPCKIDENEIIDIIKTNIDNKNPIILHAHYNSLFFSNIYKNIDNPIIHGILISGYDDERKTIIIREPLFVEFLNQEILKTKLLNLGYPFFRYQLKEKDIIEIWNNSVELNSNEVYFLIIKNKDKTKFNIINGLKDFLLIKNKKIIFNSLIYNYMLLVNESFYKNYVSRTFKGNIKIIFDCIERFFKIKNIIYYEDLKKRFIDFREKTILFLHISALRKTLLEKTLLDKIILENNNLNDEFYLFLNKLI